MWFSCSNRRSHSSERFNFREGSQWLCQREELKVKKLREEEARKAAEAAKFQENNQQSDISPELQAKVDEALKQQNMPAPMSEIITAGSSLTLEHLRSAGTPM